MARRVDQEEPEEDDKTPPPPPPPATRRPRLLVSRNLALGFLAFGVLVLVASLAFTIVSSNRAQADPEEEVTVVRRSDWKAAAPVSVSLLRAPAQLVVVGQTETAGCDTQAQCAAAVHALQQRDLLRGFTDVTHNFLAGGDGALLEGRGWGVQCPLRRARAAPALSISLIGSFTWQPPPAAQLDAVRKLIRVGVRYGYVAANYTLLADVEQKPGSFPPDRPGHALLAELSTWPHWSAGL